MGAKKESVSEVKEEEDEEDNVPIAFSKGKLAKFKPLQNRNRSFEVKKEEGDDYLHKPLKKVTNAKTGVKKEEPWEEDDESKDLIKKIKKSSERKKKMDGNSKGSRMSSNAKSSGKGNKKQKNLYDLPGQKHDPPEERDPLRIFYETLYKQLPSSEMAQFWMMEYGLLPFELAQKIYQNKQKKNNNQIKQNSPAKSIIKNPKVASAVKSTPKTTVKRKLAAASSDDDDDDDDFISSRKKPKKQKLAS
ncbi:uncharacterized protein LOC144710733 [Wolffia australiana]